MECQEPDATTQKIEMIEASPDKTACCFVGPLVGWLQAVRLGVAWRKTLPSTGLSWEVVNW